MPVLRDYVRDIGGDAILQRYDATVGLWNFDGGPERVGTKGWHGLSHQERRDQRVSRGGFWAVPTKNSLEHATMTLPNLFRARLDDLGLDFVILYPTKATRFVRNPDEELRRVCCRAFNTMYAELYAPHADRMTVSALIPMHTPQEAIEELGITQSTSSA